jgi:hypothetical protein
MIALSILIPGIPERMEQLKTTIQKYEACIERYNLNELIQIVSFIDNKKITIGEKRNILVSLAAGRYWVMSDDDDELTDRFFEVIMREIWHEPDVITYLQSARINHQKTTVEFGLNYINEDFIPDGITHRKAWYCCTWKKEAVKDARFDSTLNWGEDDLFATTANRLAKTSVHIPEVCHVYQHDSDKTAAFQ